MTLTDPISDLLTRVRNAVRAKHQTTYVPKSEIKMNLLAVLKQEGYISEYSIQKGENDFDFIKVDIKYSTTGKSLINEIKRISKPGKRIYKGYKNIPWIKNGFGVAILTTSKGLMTDKEARKSKIGGELLCTVW